MPLNPLPNKERMKIPRQHMPEQDAHQRAQNFKEVNLGLPTERAKAGGIALHRLRQAGVRDRMSGWREGAGVHRPRPG